MALGIFTFLCTIFPLGVMFPEHKQLAFKILYDYSIWVKYLSCRKLDVVDNLLVCGHPEQQQYLEIFLFIVGTSHTHYNSKVLFFPFPHPKTDLFYEIFLVRMSLVCILR